MASLKRGSILAKTNNSCTKYFRKTLNHHSTLSLFLKATLSNDCTRVSEGFLPRLLKKGCDGQTNRRRRRESRREKAPKKLLLAVLLLKEG